MKSEYSFVALMLATIACFLIMLAVGINEGQVVAVQTPRPTPGASPTPSYYLYLPIVPCGELASATPTVRPTVGP